MSSDEESSIQDEIHEIDSQTLKDIEILSDTISNYKYSLYQVIVQDDSKHNSDDMSPLFDYHGTFLQSIGYWIALLDSQPLEPPKINDKKLLESFKTITESVKKLGTMNIDSRTLTYNTLYKKSVAHPFNFVRPKLEEDE